MERTLVNHNATISGINNHLSGAERTKIAAFALIVLLSLITKNTIASLSLFSILILMDRKFIIPLLLLTPLIETILLVKEGFTVTRFVAIIFVVVFLGDLMVCNKIRYSKVAMILYGLYILITTAGLVNSIFFGEYVVSMDWNEWVVILTYLKAGMPKILVSIMLFFYLSNKSLGDVSVHLKTCVYSISVSIIIVSGYFIYYGNTGSLWYDLVRLTFQDTDPNEYSCMLAALTCFPMYLLLAGKNIYDHMLGFSSVLISFYSITLTLSRSGLFTAGLLVLISAIWSFKSGWKSTRLFIVIIFIFSLILLSFAGDELKALCARFMGYGSNIELSSMTTGRTDLWRSGLAAAGGKLFWGHGGSKIASMWVNQKALGQSSVMHSLYVEILVQYGLVGFSVFIGLVILCYKNIFKSHKELVRRGNKGLLHLPSVALLLLLFAAFSLSWEWREIIWYFLGISLGIGTAARRPSCANQKNGSLLFPASS